MPRFQWTREMFLPKQPAQVVKSKLSPAVVYLFTVGGKPCAKGFFGKQAKPAFHFNFHTVERRNEYVAQWIKDMDARTANMKAGQAKRKAYEHTLKLGDVLRSSWGYDQTNIDYYEVTKVISSKMVEIREIAQQREETGWQQGKCVPATGEYKGEPMRKLVQEGNSIRIASYACAYPVESVKVAGMNVYKADHWTAYH
jgi:hypothetical protein